MVPSAPWARRVQEQSDGTALIGGLGIEDVDLTEVQAEGLQPRRVLVE